MQLVASDIGENQRQSRRRSGGQGGNPTLRLRELGSRLRELRVSSGLTMEEAAEQLECSPAKISRMETATRGANPRDVRDLCRIYGLTSQDEIDELMNLARQAREPGWWTQYSDSRLAPYIGLEQEAVAITGFSTWWFPALLQTADYARAVIKGIARKLDSHAINERVEARMRRQQILEREAKPRYRVILDEAVLHRNVGGQVVMAAQLDKVLKYLEDETAFVQVIPFSAGAHVSVDSNFYLVEFGESAIQGPVIFMEGLIRDLYLERSAEIKKYRETIDYLRDSALSVNDSMNLISQVRADLP